MNIVRTLGLAAMLGLGGLGAASAAPTSVMPGDAIVAADHGIDKAYVVCGPFRCVRRGFYGYGYRPFGWRYGYRGYGWRGYGYRRF